MGEINGLYVANPRTAPDWYHQYDHRAAVAPDDGKPITFHWHWPRGTFDPRMSAYEIAEFILPHMGAIVGMGLLHKHPRVEFEFRAMLQMLSEIQTDEAQQSRLVRKRREIIDRILPWIKPVVHTADDDLIEMSISVSLSPQPNGPTYSYGGRLC